MRVYGILVSIFSVSCCITILTELALSTDFIIMVSMLLAFSIVSLIDNIIVAFAHNNPQ